MWAYLGVSNEAWWGVDGGIAVLEGVVGGLGRDNGCNSSSLRLGNHAAEVGVERLHDLDGAIGKGDRLGVRALAANLRTVGRGGRTSVVVTKFNNDD